MLHVVVAGESTEHDVLGLALLALVDLDIEVITAGPAQRQMHVADVGETSPQVREQRRLARNCPEQNMLQAAADDGVEDRVLAVGDRDHLHVQIKKREEGEAKNIMLGAFAGHYDVKHVVVVDEDVDIRNPKEVEWALATRFQADRDLVIVAGSQGSKLDPSTRNGVGAKMGLDATKPLDAAEMAFKRIRVPGEEHVDVRDILDRASATNWRDALNR